MQKEYNRFDMLYPYISVYAFQYDFNNGLPNIDTHQTALFNTISSLITLYQ